MIYLMTNPLIVINGKLVLIGDYLLGVSVQSSAIEITAEGKPVSIAVGGNLGGGTVTVQEKLFENSALVETSQHTTPFNLSLEYRRVGAVIQLAIAGATNPQLDVIAETDKFSMPSIAILPSTVRQAELQKGSKLRAFTGQRSPILATVFDAANQPVDLSGRSLEVKIATANEVPFLMIANGSITVTGTDHNSFYFTPPTDLVERARVFQWSLRDTSDDSNLGSGELEIIFAP